jgi:hypothetical protein
MLELVGTVVCDISVIDTETDDNRKLTTTSFTLLVEKAAWGGDDVTSDPQGDVLIDLLNRVELAGDVAEEALQKSNEAIERSEGVQGIYVGSGDMPEGYSVQIDPEGAVLEMDVTLKSDSVNPVENRVIYAALEKKANIYNGLGKLGIAQGSEREDFEDIANAMKANSMLIYTVEGGKNAVIYPGAETAYGMVTVTKIDSSRVVFEYTSKLTCKRWVKVYSRGLDGVGTLTDWVQYATVDEINDIKARLDKLEGKS